MIEAVCGRRQRIQRAQRAGADRLNAANHESRGQDGHVEVVELFLVLDLDHGLGKAVGDLLAAVQAFLNVLDHAAVRVNQSLVELLPALDHVVGENLEERDEVR
jgi:hypothetical protein